MVEAKSPLATSFSIGCGCDLTVKNSRVAELPAKECASAMVQTEAARIARAGLAAPPARKRNAVVYLEP